MSRLYVFTLIRFYKPCEGSVTHRTESKYQVPATSETQAMYKLGCTFNSHEIADTEEEAIKMCDVEENFKAIVVKLDSIH